MLRKQQLEGLNAYIIIGHGTTATGNSGEQLDVDITNITAIFLGLYSEPID